MISFTVDSVLRRIVFGAGTFSRLPEEVEHIGAKRVMIISTPGRTELLERASSMLGATVVARFDRAVVHVPEQTAASAREMAAAAHADCLVTLGGGSAIGAAKAVAVDSGVPIVAVATTYGGSEMTPIYGFTSAGQKRTGRDPRARPRAAIYDSDLTLTLPPRTTACSGLNAIAHCIEALYAPDANPLSSAAARDGYGLMSRALPVLADTPADREGRDLALQGAWLAGFALGFVEMGLHHKLCHVLGGAFELPHADTHAVMIPYTAAFNHAALPTAMGNAGEAILGMARQIGAPLSLRELGMPEEGIGRAADLALRTEYANPRPATLPDIERLLSAAWSGDASYVLSYR